MKAWNYLSGWTSFSLPKNIQKRLYKFLLRKAIGQFLQNELDLENFDIELMNGSVELRDLDLNLQTLNKLLNDTPFILEEGRVGSINASIPWTTFWSGDISLKIQGLHLALRPIKNKSKSSETNPSTPTNEEPIMSSSLHFADDFLKSEIEQDATQRELHESIQKSFPTEEVDDLEGGLQVLTKVIDKMLAKIKLDIVDTLIRIIHKSAVPLVDVPGDNSGKHEYFIDIRIPRISYFDETPEFNNSAAVEQELMQQSVNNLVESSILLPPATNETIKCIIMNSPEIWLRSSPISNLNDAIYLLQSQSETTINDTNIQDDLEDDLSQTKFFETDQGTSSLFQHNNMSGSITPKAIHQRQQQQSRSYEALLFTTMNERSYVRMKLRPSVMDTSILPIKQVDFLVTHIRAIISPLQVAFFMDLLDAMTPTDDNSNTPSEPLSRRQSHTSTMDTTQPNTSNTLNSHHVDSVLDDLNSFHTTTNNTPPPQSHFATSSSYYEQPQQQVSVPDRKIKISMSLLELFILGDDDHSSIDWNQPQKNKTHVRFAIEQLNIRLQQFALNSSSIIGIKITNIVLDEWIKRPADSHSSVADEMNDRSRTKYEVYNPILQFDNRIKDNYRDEELFPSYSPRDQIHEENGNVGGEVVRVRIERKQQQFPERNKSRFSADNLVSNYDEDINVEIQAFQLQIDPRIIDRLENYVNAFMDYSKLKEEQQQQQQFNYTTHAQQEQEQRHPTSSVFDDLQPQENTFNRKIRVRCAFIRVLLFVPDMSLTSTRDEFNDRFHKSQLSLDIKKLVATWSSKDQPPINEEAARFGLKDKKKPTKLNVELNYVNVFMYLKQDDMAKTWFTAKTSQGKKYFSEGALCPTIEIIVHDPNTMYPTTSARRSGYFGAGSDIPFNLFDFLTRNENFDGEQKLHMPMEDQSESAMIFKQRTMETSRFVINCHFPQTHMNLTKPLWDKVQIIQNDLLLWQPKFLIQQPVDDLMSSSSISMISQSHERLGYHPRRFSQQPTPVPTISSLQESQAQQKTLFSVAAVLSNGVWDLRTSDVNKYRFQFSEFRYFAAMKHLGANENMTTLDIEELSLTHISNPSRPIPLLYRTIPKSIHPKRDTSMVSLFSRLTSFPESNRISKVTSIVACNVCWKATMDIEFINQIIDFQKVPEDMVFIDPPTQYIKIFAHVLEASIDYEPINSPSRAVVLFDGVQVITDILAGQSFVDIKTCIETVDLLLIDDVKELKGFQQLEGMTSDARRFWSTVGLVNLLTVSNMELQVKLKLDIHAIGPQVDVALVSTDIGLDSSTDSFQTLLNLITFISNNGDAPLSEASPKHKLKSPKKKKRREPHQMNAKPPGSDLLASLDENAFRTSLTSSKISPPTLIEAPDMEEFSYVEEFYTTSNKDTSSSIFINHASRPPTKPRRKQHRMKTAEDIIRVLVSPDEQEFVVEDYFGIEKKVVEPKSAVDINKALLFLRIRHVNLVWKLYDGYAWEYVRAEMTAQKKKQDGFTVEEIKTTADAFIEIKLDDISVDFDLMPPHDETALYFHLLIKDVEIIDNIKTSTWKKFLGYMKQAAEENPRELDACMVDLQLISLRPVVDDPQQEFRLKAKILPMRLYVDQDALNFLVRYFTFEKSHLRSTHAANQSISPQQQQQQQQQGSQISDSDEEDDSDDAKEDNGMFFQYVDIYPITLKVDYKPKYINYGNIKGGQLAELVNLFHLDGAEMSLTHVKLTGIKGIDGLLERLSQEWLPHIKNTQVTNMVSGVSPIRSIVNLSNGVADLVLLPIQQYKKDGRLIKGIQRGTSSFARTTAIEAIKLSSKMATGTQVILEHADGFFSPPSPTNTRSQLLQDQHFVYTDIYGIDIPDDYNDDNLKRTKKEKSAAGSSSAPESSKSSSSNKKRPSSLSASPSDLSEGFQIAYQNLSKNLGSAAQTIFAVPTEIAHQETGGSDNYYNTEHDSSSSSKSQGGGTKAVIRAVPVAVIKPMIGLTGAFQSILTGLRNSIDPVMRLQSEDKYKKRK